MIKYFLKFLVIFGFVFLFFTIFTTKTKAQCYIGEPGCDVCTECQRGPNCIPCDPPPDGGCTGVNSCGAGQSCCGGECIAGGSGCPGEDPIVCAVGYHDNGNCVPGQPINPPCCSPDAVATATPTSTTTTGCTQCLGGTACNACSAAPNQGYLCVCTGSLGGGRYTSCKGEYRTSCLNSTPPPGTPGPTPANCGGIPCPQPAPWHGVRGTVFNDLNNTCSRQDGSYNDPLTGYSGASIIIDNTILRGRAGGGFQFNHTYTLPLSFRSGRDTYRQTLSSDSTSTITLSGIPAGYRCSDGPGCPSCPVRSNVVTTSNNVNFYITNQVIAPPVVNNWWQVKDGDITTNGNITSSVPATLYLNTIGSGGFPGVPVYGGTLTTGSGTVSTKRWSANTTTSLTRQFDYSYFKNLIPSDIVPADTSLLSTGTGTTYGFEWFRVTGDFSIDTDIDFGTRKVILFVETGDLNINANLNLTDNQGFFAAIVNGNININPLVNNGVSPAIEGLYMADGTFSTGAGDTQLYLRGSVAALGGMVLQRDLVDNSSPAELFEFAPDQIMLFPEKLKFSRTKWIEVAP